MPGADPVGSVVSEFLNPIPDELSVSLPEITNSIGMRLKLIPAGKFLMGSPETEVVRDHDEGPQRVVSITEPFYLGVYEVTQAEFERVIGTNPSRFTGARNPVESVSWEEAVSFCRQLSQLPEEQAAGHAYRLPTEAEWEYACRAGTTTAYSFGDAGVGLGEYAWYNGNSGGTTHPVGEKPPNSFGLYDMHGNVWEWCSDRYGGYPDNTVAPGRQMPSNSSDFVLRGGSWYFARAHARSARRGATEPGTRYEDLGIRLACSAVQ